MQKICSSRLYYGQYPYKIIFTRTGNIKDKSWVKNWNPTSFVKWLQRHKIDYRIYKRVKLQKRLRQITVKLSLFVANRSAYEKCIEKYPKYIDSVTEPYADSHIDILKNNTQIVIRPTLLYKKYQYVINFRRTYHQRVDDIDEWVHNNFSVTDFINSRVKWIRTGYNPRIYLAAEEDLVFIKLVWGERIRQITVICTLDSIPS